MSEDDLLPTRKVTTDGGAGELRVADDERPTAAVDRPPHAAAPQGSQRVLPRTTLPAPLGPYTLERRLGIGGMAEVFLARRDGPAGFSKSVVVKRILPHLAEDPRFVDMFLREAQTAAELNHTNVVQVYELGEVDGQYYIAMEYVDGVTLYKLARRAWRRGRSIPMEVILRAIADAALGLHHAHTLTDASGKPLHLVHRDISPDNLIISRGGMTKVLDFGIAKGSESRGVTRTGELKGKIPYMSPEQIRGEPLDGRSDLYSLGVTLYWLLTGERPFDGATDLMTLQGVLNDAARPPSAVNPYVPPAVDDIVLALLAKDPDERPASGAELYDALIALAPMRTTQSTAFVGEMVDAIDDDAPASKPASEGFVPATPLTTRLGSNDRVVLRKAVEKAQRTPPSKRTLVAAIGGVAAALTVGALGVWLSGDDEVDTEVTVLAATVQAPPPAVPEPAAAEERVPEPAAAQAEAPTEATAPAVEEGDAREATPAREEAPVVVEAAAAEAAVAEGTAPSTKARAQRATTSKRRAQVSTRAVTTKAPSAVTWSLPSGRRLGRGSGRLEVPANVDVLVATTPDTLGRSQVRIVGGAVDYGQLSSGQLSLRVFPFAKVTVGNRLLGTTPLSPVSLVEGTYTVTLEHEGKVVKRKVQVPAGGTRVLKVDMRAE